MAMEHFDEKIVPSFKIGPNSPAAGYAAAAAVVNTCHGHANYPTPSPSKILSGSFMSGYLGTPSISSPAFGTSSHSTPKSNLNAMSFEEDGMSQSIFGASNIAKAIRDDPYDSKSLSSPDIAGTFLFKKIESTSKSLIGALKSQRKIIRKMQKVRKP